VHFLPSEPDRLVARDWSGPARLAVVPRSRRRDDNVQRRKLLVVPVTQKYTEEPPGQAGQHRDGAIETLKNSSPPSRPAASGRLKTFVTPIEQKDSAATGASMLLEDP